LIVWLVDCWSDGRGRDQDRRGWRRKFSTMMVVMINPIVAVLFFCNHGLARIGRTPTIPPQIEYGTTTISVDRCSRAMVQYGQYRGVRLNLNTCICLM
jgi:hypothetical protein